MTATYVGELTLAAAIPAADAAALAGYEGINGALPDLQARVASLQASITALGGLVPSTFVDMATRASTLLASINVAIATPGLVAPIDFGAAIVALTTLLNFALAAVGEIQAQAEFIADFRAALDASSGVHAVVFDGPIGALGAEVNAVLASPIPGGTTRAIVLATTDSATWAVMSQVFRVTPP